MKSGLLITHLLLLSLAVIHQAQGMRLIRKGSLPSTNHHFMSNINKKITEEEASFSGRARKLMITEKTTISSKNHEKKKKEEEMSVSSSSTTTREKREAAAETESTYPGILDIAGMDYSQARRKPPIHN